MEFKDKIKELRLEKELSQKKLAEILSLSQSCITKLEAGLREPTGSTLKSYSQFFNVTIDYLIGNDEALDVKGLQNERQFFPQKKKIMLRLKEIREDRNLSQQEVATAIETSQTNIARWENGKNEPSYLQLVKLADFYNCSIDFLVGRDEDFSKVTLQSQIVLSSEEKDLIKYYRGIEKPARLAIFNTAKSFYNQA